MSRHAHSGRQRDGHGVTLACGEQGFTLALPVIAVRRHGIARRMVLHHDVDGQGWPPRAPWPLSELRQCGVGAGRIEAGYKREGPVARTLLVMVRTVGYAV